MAWRQIMLFLFKVNIQNIPCKEWYWTLMALWCQRIVDQHLSDYHLQTPVLMRLPEFGWTRIRILVCNTSGLNCLSGPNPMALQTTVWDRYCEDSFIMGGVTWGTKHLDPELSILLETWHWYGMTIELVQSRSISLLQTSSPCTCLHR